MDNFFVLTGGPGVGKTSLLEALKKEGFPIIPEEARHIIKEQVKQHGDALPWANKQKYANLMLERSIHSFEEQKQLHPNLICFFDRGIPDSFCYANMENLELDPELLVDAGRLRYNPLVFILPPWEDIYEMDQERKQTWEEAMMTYQAMQETYLSQNYQLVEIPVDSVENRRNFVLKTIASVMQLKNNSY